MEVVATRINISKCHDMDTTSQIARYLVLVVAVALVAGALYDPVWLPQVANCFPRDFKNNQHKKTLYVRTQNIRDLPVNELLCIVTKF
jgi:hypothetical protein